MSTDDDAILAALRKLAGKVDAAPVMLWGTVTQASPLMVTLDGAIDPSGAPVAVPAQSAVGPLPVGWRVWCTRQSRRVTVTSGGRGMFAHRGQTNGFQGFNSGQYQPTLAAPQIQSGGITADGTSGLRVPVAGMYAITGHVYFSGAGGAQPHINTQLVVAGTVIASGRGNQASPFDMEATAHLPRYKLNAGDVVTLAAGTTSATNTYGTTGFNGTRLTVEYVCPPMGA